VVTADAAALALSMGRSVAEELMADTCTIGRPTGDPVTDPVTGVVSTPLTQVYPDPSWPADHRWKHGPCMVQTYEAQEHNPEAGGATFTVQRYTVKVPVGSFAPKIGDVIDMTTAGFDPNLVGRRYRVVALLHKTRATQYRLGVEEDV